MPAVAPACIQIVAAHEPPHLPAAAALFEEYAASLDISLDFQGFDAELAALPGDYRLPHGCLLLALVDGRPAGCVAMRPLEPGICEMKRLYVRPAFRGLALGRLLVGRLCEQARRAGHVAMRLDTLPSMAGALAVYRSCGFRDIEPYCFNPHAGAVFLEKAL